MTRYVLFLALLCTVVSHSNAQRSPGARGKLIATPGSEKNVVYYGNANEAPRAIEFTERAVTYQDFVDNISRYLNLSADFTFTETESSIDQLGTQHRLLQQVYNGIEIEGMGYRVHAKNGFLTSANGRAIRDIQINVQTVLSEQQCFQMALQSLQTKDTTQQRGRKLIVSKGFSFLPESFVVAYQFDIDVSLVERWRVSVDAITGALINKTSLVNSCFHGGDNDSPPQFGTATGLTNYYGNQTIQVEKSDNDWSQLVGQTANGGRIATYSFNNASMFFWIFQFNVPLSPISSNTNTYNDPYQRPGVSVQWAAEKTYEYFFLKHGRRSYDNAGSTVRSLVHVDQKLDNAFWSRNTLLFGDGSNNNPLVELDVVGHEFSHGVTQNEANLQYYHEPGALNESFSDIFGKAIEFDTFKDTATWQLSRHFQPGGFRDFSNPNLKGQPDTWMGDLWFTGYEDYGGVHYNSGVQNFWYYLLCVGGSGKNDRQENYSVTAIGMEAATKIAYRNLTEYLGNFSDYLDARIGSLLATADLYGKNSITYQQVMNAWDAVGVIQKPIITKVEPYDITATTVKIKGNLFKRGNNVSYFFEYGPTPGYGSRSATYQYSDAVTGTITGLQSATKYYLRLVAVNENGSSSYATEFTTISLAPLVTLQQTVDVTEHTATLFGRINPNSLATSYHFEYGLTPSLGSFTPLHSLPDTTEFLSISIPVNNLVPRKKYFYKLVATNGFATTASATANFFTAVPPQIFSFSPEAGIVGSEVVITGKNFQVVPGLNLVNFGATRATVLSSTQTQIKVKVPAGASLANITVLDAESGLAGQSAQKFVPTFSAEFKKKDLQLTVGIDAWINQTIVEDMDGDGKPDIIASHYAGFSVFQNVHQAGDLTEASFVRNIFNIENTPSYLYTADFDGNGRQDVAFIYTTGLRIYPNHSVPGYIFFGPPVDLPQIQGFWNATFKDFDIDGHVDIAVTKYSKTDTSTVTIFRNQNPKGLIDAGSFIKSFSATLPQLAFYLDANDLNNDGKPEIIVSSLNKNYASILLNESVAGSFAFGEIRIEDLLKARDPQYLLQDFNQDGWADVLSYPQPRQDENMTLLENKRTSTSVSMVPPIVPLSGYSISSVVPADINGDGKVDLLVGSDKRSFTLLKNNSVARQPFSPTSFERFEEYGMKLPPNSGIAETNLTVSDLNGDGRPEVMNVNSYYYGPRDGYNFEIWQNAPPNCPDPAMVDVSVSANRATLNIPANVNLQQLEVAYLLKGSSNWIEVTTNSFNLPYGGSYQLRIRAKCYLGFTEYIYKDFVTDCIDVSSFSIVNIQSNAATVQAFNFSSMEVQYSPSQQGLWVTLQQANNLITNLKNGTTYDVRYRGRCSTPATFNYLKFTTLCPKLNSITINDIRFNSARVNWTSSSAENALLEYSADNVNWNTVRSNQIISPLNPAQKYFVRGRIMCADVASDLLLTSFTTPCPKVSTLLLDAVTPFSARVSWSDESNTNNYSVTYEIDGRGLSSAQTQTQSFTLNGLQPGTRCKVRVAPECSGKKEFVEADFNTTCFAPVNLSIDHVTHTSAEISWDSAFAGVPYFIDYSISGSTNWRSLQTSSTSVVLTQLRPAADYQVRVYIACTSVPAQFATVQLKTAAYDQTTIAPNPAAKTITIYPSIHLIGRRFSIFDSMGKMVANGNLLDYTIDLSDFNQGIYTLVIEGEKMLKFIKL